MIVSIGGSVLKVGVGDKLDYVDLMTAAGLGYRVYVIPGSVITSVGETLTLYTSYIVKEESQTLYGFLDSYNRDFFELLLTVAGIGPKIGMSIMAMYSVENVKNFIKEGDYSSLSKVSGLGAKGAKKIILELQSKIGECSELDLTSSAASDVVVKEVGGALKALGFKGEELKMMQKRAEELYKESPESSVEQLLQSVLRS